MSVSPRKRKGVDRVTAANNQNGANGGRVGSKVNGVTKVAPGLLRQNYIIENRDIEISPTTPFPQPLTRELCLRFEVRKIVHSVR